MKTLVEKQRQFFNSNTTKDIDFRLSQLDLLQNTIKNNEGVLCEAIYSDFKKSAFDTISTELELIYQDIREAKAKLRNWSRIKRVPTNLVNFPSKSYIVPEPLGVCLVIGAWNYPFQLSLAPVAAAIAAGNTVILKPSELTVESSKAMTNMISQNIKISISIRS